MFPAMTRPGNTGNGRCKAKGLVLLLQKESMIEKMSNPRGYQSLLRSLKERIQQAQIRAASP